MGTFYSCYHLSRVKLGPTMDVINECPLLQPISFKLSVQRNLSSNWFTEIPDLDVSGRLESIHVSFESVYSLTINKNICK